MIAMRTIVCPVDFSEATGRQVELAGGLARLFGARLVLHHNSEALAPGAGVGWLWSGDHPEVGHQHIGRDLEMLADAHAAGLDVELRVTEGPPSMAVLAVCEAAHADLVVICTHHEASDEHTSVTEQVVARAHRPVLALHAAGQEPAALRLELPSGAPLQVALVPTDLTPESRPAVAFAFELARALPLRLHLLHYLNHGGFRDAADATRALRELVPEDLLPRTRLDVQADDPIRGIVQTAAGLGAACIVMGQHARSPLRRWFSRDTSRAVLHDASCPVWYVPSVKAA